MKGKIPPDEFISELKELQTQLGIAKQGPMTEQRFNHVTGDYDEDDGFTYSRPVLKNKRVEDDLNLPYQRFILFKMTKNSKLLSAHKVGEPTGGILKIIVKIQPKESSLEDIDYEVATAPHGSIPFPIDFFHPAFVTG